MTKDVWVGDFIGLLSPYLLNLFFLFFVSPYVYVKLYSRLTDELMKFEIQLERAIISHSEEHIINITGIKIFFIFSFQNY